MSVYAEAVTAVFDTLSSSPAEPFSPVLLCLPDVLVLRDRTGPDREETLKDKPDRITISLSWGLDGHACISSLTVGHLALGLHADFEAWLVAKVGDRGQALLSFVEKEIGNYADGMFKCFQCSGIDRHIETPSNTGEQVTREIEMACEANQLSMTEFEAFGLLPWLRNRPYSLLIGDAESCFVTNSPNRLEDLYAKALAIVVDTAVFKAEPDRSRKLWQSVCNLTQLNPRTLISVSDVDAKDLAMCLGHTGSGTSMDHARVLLKSLPAGMLVLHSRWLNVAFFVGESAAPVIVPTCKIKPTKGTNGAGDTFNGGLGLAAMALAKHNKGERFSPREMKQVLSFATAVVSFRLATGSYPTRAELILESASYTPNEIDAALLRQKSGSSAVRIGAGGQNHHPTYARLPAVGWDDLPKLFLVDLDHTLCDSRTWRIESTLQAVDALNLHWRPEEVKRVYNHLYDNHGSFESLLGNNLRYCWNLDDLFYLFWHLNQYPADERIGKLSVVAGKGTNSAAQLVEIKRQMWKLKQNERCQAAVVRATATMKRAAAFPYNDAIAALYHIRDVLKFQLRLVTEGDGSVQHWKVDKLGLSRLFPDGNQIVELAFLSQQQLSTAFRSALADTDEGAREELRRAQTVCLKIQQTLKQSFRGRALHDCIKALCDARQDMLGVFVCTLGDRNETDVVPYMDLKKRISLKRGKPDPGLVVARLERGPYAHSTDGGGGFVPDISVKSLADLAQKLGRPGFWRGKQPLRREDISFSLTAEEKPSDDEREILRRVRNRHPEVDSVIEHVLEQLDLQS